MVSLEVPKLCLKCGHVRTAADPSPEYACPKCGAVYAKVEAAQRAKEAARAEALSRRQAAKVDPEAPDHMQDPGLRANREHERSLSIMAHVVYALYILPIGLTALVGLVIAYVMRGRAGGTWVESHFSWQIGTFWRALLSMLAVYFLGKALVVGSLLAWAGKGAGAGLLSAVGLLAIFYALLMAIAVWCIYRIAKGWIGLFHDEAVA